VTTQNVTTGHTELLFHTVEVEVRVQRVVVLISEVCRILSVVSAHAARLLVSVLNIDGLFWRWTATLSARCR